MDDLLRSTVFYCAALAGLLGLFALLRPMPTLVLRTRRRALAVIALCVLALTWVTVIVPASTTITAPRTHLDTFAPTYQFREIHETTVAAPPARVFAAIKTVPPEEIALFRTFTWIRRFGRPLPPNIMNAPRGQSILDTAVRGGFLLLAEEAGREIVVGTVVIRPLDLRITGSPTPEMYRTANMPGLAKATMSFLVEPEGAGSRVVTETRVFATDEGALHAFTPYWRVIYPGSAILRVTWLRAIKSRAEGPNSF